MKKVAMSALPSFLLLFLLAALPVRIMAMDLADEPTKNLIAFVEKAAKLVETKGEAAFPEFRVKGGEWFKETYVSVWTPQGVCLCHPVSTDLEGKMALDLTDPEGRPIAKWWTELLAEHDSCWIHYKWPEPGQTEPVWKHAYRVKVKGPEGKVYLVGAGGYKLKIQPLFVQDSVERAVELLASKGQGAFEEFNDPKGRFIYEDAILLPVWEGVEIREKR